MGPPAPKNGAIRMTVFVYNSCSSVKDVWLDLPPTTQTEELTAWKEDRAGTGSPRQMGECSTFIMIEKP